MLQPCYPLLGRLSKCQILREHLRLIVASISTLPRPRKVPKPPMRLRGWARAPRPATLRKLGSARKDCMARDGLMTQFKLLGTHSRSFPQQQLRKISYTAVSQSTMHEKHRKQFLV